MILKPLSELIDRLMDLQFLLILLFRTEVLFDEIREKAEQFKPFNNALVFFFMSDISPLSMDELYPLNEWMEEFPDEFMLRWGMAINPPDAPRALKAIVLLQNNEGKDE